MSFEYKVETRTKTLPNFQDTLNRTADEGWELDHTSDHPNDNHAIILIFRRWKKLEDPKKQA